MKKLSLLLLLPLLPFLFGAIYYVASDGSGNFTTIAQVVNYDKSTGFLPGDIIAFRRGDIWRETLSCWSSGTSGHPITYTSYGTGDEPIIDGSDIVTNWIDEGDGTWSKEVNPTAQVWEDDIRLDYKDYEKGESINGVGQWGYDVKTGKVIIRCTDDANPNTHVIEVGARNVGCWISHNFGTYAKSNNSYIIIENITFQKTAGLFTSLTGGTSMIDGNGDYLIYQIISSQGNNNIVRNLISRQCGGGRSFSITEPTYNTVWAANVEFWKSPYSEMYNVTAYDGSTVLLNMETLDNAGEYYIMHDCIGYNAWNIGIIFNGGQCYRNKIYNIGLSMYGDGQGEQTIKYKTAFMPSAGARIESDIYQNIFYDCPIGFWSYGNGDSDVNFFNNVFYNISSYLAYIQTGTHGFNFYNNNFIGKDDAVGIWMASDGVTINYDMVFKNNIIKLSNGMCFVVGSKEEYLSDHNSFFRENSGNLWQHGNDVYSTLSSWQLATSQDSHSIASDPLLSSRYRLKSGSPAINAGVDVGVDTDYLGNTRDGSPDIGCFESGNFIHNATIKNATFSN